MNEFKGLPRDHKTSLVKGRGGGSSLFYAGMYAKKEANAGGKGEKFICTVSIHLVLHFCLPSATNIRCFTLYSLPSGKEESPKSPNT